MIPMSERAVSIVVNYAMILAILTLLSTGLVVTTNSFVEDQQERAIRSQLHVVGNHLAADLVTVDQLARTVDDSGTVRLTSDFPGRVAGSEYRITISHVEEDTYRITLTSTDPTESVQVEVRSQTAIESGTVRGGTVSYEVDGGSGEPVEVADG